MKSFKYSMWSNNYSDVLYACTNLCKVVPGTMNLLSFAWISESFTVLCIPVTAVIDFLNCCWSLIVAFQALDVLLLYVTCVVFWLDYQCCLIWGLSWVKNLDLDNLIKCSHLQLTNAMWLEHEKGLTGFVWQDDGWEPWRAFLFCDKPASQS